MRRCAGSSAANSGPFCSATKRLVQRPALRGADAEHDDLRLHRLVGRAKRRIVLHADQVADDAPDVAQPVVHALERLNGARPGRLDGALQPLELAGELGEQRAHARLDVLGADLSEARQATRIQQRVRVCRRLAHQKRRVYETSVPGSSGRATSSTQL